MNADGSFTGQRAPCGQIVAGENYEDHDEEVVVTREIFYMCGCQSIRREYHDGSVTSASSGTTAACWWTSFYPGNNAGDPT